MNWLIIAMALCLVACGGTPQQTQLQAQQEADNARSLETMLNVSSTACLHGVTIACNFVRSYEYCMEGVDAACADTRVYGRIILNAAAAQA